MNAIAKEMGFYSFNFEPELSISAIEDVVAATKPDITPHNPSGAARRSRVRVRAMPDKVRPEIFKLLEY